MPNPRAILIAGPTASGKSRLAIDLARRLNGVVINTDSMQVYRDLRILTARPSEAEEREAPHCLFGYQDAADAGSVMTWLRDARQAFHDCEIKGLLPIFTGGTGLYFRALIEGLSDIPKVPDDVRTDLRNWAQGRTPAELHERLLALDPETAATLRPSDPQRNLRALEIVTAFGRPLSSFHRDRQGSILSVHDCCAVFLSPDRTRLRERIGMRFDQMIETGALDEVAALKARELDPALPAMRAHGVPALIRFLDGQITLAEAIEIGKNDTRRYAKRQHTWFRHQAPWFHWLSPDDAMSWFEHQLSIPNKHAISD